MNQRQTLDLRKMAIKADEVRAPFQCVCRDPDVVRGNRSSLPLQTRADEAESVGCVERYRQELDEAIGEKRLELGPVPGVGCSITKTEQQLSGNDGGKVDALGASSCGDCPASTRNTRSCRAGFSLPELRIDLIQFVDGFQQPRFFFG